MSIVLKTLSIRFYCRESKKRSDGKSPIEMAINLDGARIVTHLPRKECPDVFARLTRSKKTNPLREYLCALESRLREFETECIRNGEQLTVDMIRAFIEAGYVRKTITIQTLHDEFFKSLRLKRDAGAMTERRFRKYEVALDHFFEGTGIDANEPVTNIKNHTIQDFKHYLIKQKYEPATIAGFLQCVKSMVLFGLRNGLLKENPYLGIKIGRKSKKVNFLTEDEVERIRKKEMPTKGLSHVKDLFLFQCFTAVSYCDMALLEPEDYHINKDGYTFIEKQRKKTGVTFLVVLLPEALEIAKKYDYRLPVISNQRYNTNLKEIATLCGIDKSLHSHVGRHTAATFLLNARVPMEIVAKVLGHTTTAQTRHYAKLLDESVFKEFKRLEERQKGTKKSGPRN